MQIQWVNHASFVLEHGDVRLISDPWLDGLAFADSWSLLSETRFRPEDFATITHLWLSHEHPDYFSPRALQSIPEAVRRRITVLTQATRDRKVFEFCKALGFASVVELPSGEWFTLSPDVQVICQPVKLDDSWLAVRAGGTTLLNLNDCMLDSEGEVREVSAQVGPVDILLTQFSFASWIGNPDDQTKHAQAAGELRDRIILQTRIIGPRWVIPFASFVWFCHAENAFMNEKINRVHQIVELLRSETEAKPIVLYPGDAWDPSAEHDPTADALSHYAKDYESVASRPTKAARRYELEELATLAEGFGRRLIKFHGWPLRLANRLGRVPATPIWLTDHGRGVLLSLGGLVPDDVGFEGCDIAMSSDALAYTLQNMWGGLTLVISGRFSVPSGGELLVGGPPGRFRRYVVLADDANHGWPLRREVAFRLRARLSAKANWLARHTPQPNRTQAQ